MRGQTREDRQPLRANAAPTSHPEIDVRIDSELDAELENSAAGGGGPQQHDDTSIVDDDGVSESRGFFCDTVKMTPVCVSSVLLNLLLIATLAVIAVLYTRSASDGNPAPIVTLPPPPLAASWCDGAQGRNGAVSTTNELATQVGLEVLQRGGNAADAAVAVQFALSVVQPQSTGIAGGSFIMYYNASNRQVFALDGREEAPEAFHGHMYCNTSGTDQNCLTADGCETCESDTTWIYDERHAGGNAVGVPGVVSAALRLLDDFGTMDREAVIRPAVRLARVGFPMYDHLHFQINQFKEYLMRYDASRAIFLPRANGTQSLEIGETISFPELADTLEEIITHGAEVFYEGEIAEDIVQAAQAAVNPVTGLRGVITMDDMRAYRAVYREPVKIDIDLGPQEGPFFPFPDAPDDEDDEDDEDDAFQREDDGKRTVHGFPFPSCGGMVIGQALKIVEQSGIDFKSFAHPHAVEYLHRFIDLQNVVWSDRNHFGGDPDFNDVPLAELLDDEYCASRAELFELNRAVPIPVAHGEPADFPGAEMLSTPPKQIEHGTTHFTIVDSQGNMASFTTSLEENLGSDVVVPGRGFLLNNQLTDFTDKPGDANGVFQNRPEGGRRPRSSALTTAPGVPEDAGEGGKRPMSSMSPTIILDGFDRPVLGVGSPGGAKIPGTVLNVIFNRLFFNEKIQAATDLSRVISQNDANGAMCESLIFNDESITGPLTARGFNFSLYDYNLTLGELSRPLGFPESVAVIYPPNDSGAMLPFDLCGAADHRLETAQALAY